MTYWEAVLFYVLSGAMFVIIMRLWCYILKNAPSKFRLFFCDEDEDDS